MEKPEISGRNDRNIIRRMYDWVLHWAETPYGAPALFILAFAESSFFPVPPDILLIALAVSVRSKAFKYAALCSIGSLIGGLFGYGIGHLFWYSGTEFSAIANFFFDNIPGFTVELFDKVRQLYNENAFMVVFTAGFTPIPYKIITIAGGVSDINLPMFLVASAVSRSLRFFLVAGFIWKFGEPITRLIDKYFNKLAILFTILLIGGVMAVKLLVH